MLKVLSVAAALVCAAVVASPASAHGFKAPKAGATLEQKERYLKRTLDHDTRVLRFIRRHRLLYRPDCEPPWEHALNPKPIPRRCLKPGQRDSILYVRWIHRRHAKAAGRDLRAVQRLMLSRVDRTWGQAVAYTNRCFPGTAGWLYAVSGDEGGGGLWTWNGGGNTISEATRARYRVLERRYGTYYLLRYRPGSAASDVGGWVQFMPGTFLGYVDDAIAAARSRGCRVLPEWRSWFSPAGQALTAGYMYWSGRSGHHWAASGH